LTGFRARIALGAALWLVLAAGGAAGQGSPFGVTVGSAAAEWRPFLRLDGILRDDRALRDALDSGLPVRFNFRVELWERAVFDRLVGAETASLALLQDPIDRTVYVLTNGREQVKLRGLLEAERAVMRNTPSSLRPNPRGGRYYYLATLEVETLSLSDLQELQRWLRGEARPAVAGRTPVGRAVRRGVERAVVRMVGLPVRRFEARTPIFAVG
jgi:hypothetical protein